jgi:agmatine/peptidylarginine deiminase
MKTILFFILLLTMSFSQIPEKRVVAEWEPAIGTMIRWPLGIPSDLVVELASDDVLYVLIENNFQQNSALNAFNQWGVNILNVEFINTQTYSHWTRDHGPEFIIGENHWEVINQKFNGYPTNYGCEFVEADCDEEMLITDCVGIEFCNNQPQYADEGYDCYVNNDLCEDFNGDGQIMDWLGDGYCDNGNWGPNFMCDEYSFDCGDCGGQIIDENGYCGDNLNIADRNGFEGRYVDFQVRGWEEDDDTNVDFANQLGWNIKDLDLYWTGGNFMTDGYGMGFSTQLMVNENMIQNEVFQEIMNQELHFSDYYIFDNPNELSIQHIDCMAKLVDAETLIIKQVSESSPEYECIEDFAESFYSLNTFYDRPFEIKRIYCPEIPGGPWEDNPVAAYTNSLILNNKVLVPKYGIPEDELAIQVFKEAMPGYDVIGFDPLNSEPWYGEDALHCRTKGIFDPNMIHISHKSIRSNEIFNNNIEIKAEIIDYSFLPLASVKVHWKYSAEDGPYSQFEMNYISDDVYAALFPEINLNSEIEYFIVATNSIGTTVSHPIAGWHNFILDNLIGDINGDNLINVQDVILIVNYILEGTYNEFSDLNSDNQLNVLDIIALVSLILSE